MPITNQKKWNDCVFNNDDPYGKCAVDAAREIMKILDKGEEIKDVHALVCEADRIAQGGQGELTGFLAGAAASIVAKVHSRGDEFRQKWNESHGVKEEKAKGGTVNPAIITIGSKK